MVVLNSFEVTTTSVWALKRPFDHLKRLVGFGSFRINKNPAHMFFILFLTFPYAIAQTVKSDYLPVLQFSGPFGTAYQVLASFLFLYGYNIIMVIDFPSKQICRTNISYSNNHIVGNFPPWRGGTCIRRSVLSNSTVLCMQIRTTCLAVSLNILNI